MLEGDTWSKKLSKNDVGETDSNQSGIYILADGKDFFSPMRFESRSDSRDITVTDENDVEHSWKLKWYIKPDNRKEFHITYCHALMRTLGVASGDWIHIKKIDQDRFHVSFSGSGFTSNAEKRVETAATSNDFMGSSGQGFLTDVRVKNSIERHAMNLVRDHFEQQGFKVTDTSQGNPYDFLCERDQENQLFLEVKGTTTQGETVILTKNEVLHFRENEPNTALAIVSKIRIEFVENEPVASAGILHVIMPWAPVEDDLTPISYRYDVP